MKMHMFGCIFVFLAGLSSLQAQLSYITISGYVRTAAGAGVTGVLMNGLPTSPTTNSQGYYLDSALVYRGSYGWSGTVKPTKTGYRFTPDSTVYSNVTSNQTTSYTGTPATVSITIGSSPSGLSIIVDGQSYTSPQSFSWTSGSSHTIGITSPQIGGIGTRYVWSSWSDGGATTHTIIPTSNGTYTSSFGTQYQLTMSAGTGGTVSPASGWYNSSQQVSIMASASTDYTFSAWTGSGSGSYSGSSPAASVTMNGPIVETASFMFTLPTVLVTIGSSPSGLSIIVDGQSYTSPQSFSWTSGSTHTIGTTSPQSGGIGTRYVWSSWSDGGATTHTIIPTSNGTYTASFGTQYLLTMGAGTGGAVSPASGWYSSSQQVSIMATANTNYTFSAWAGSGPGSYTGASISATVMMNGPVAEMAIFIPSVTAVGIIIPNRFALLQNYPNPFNPSTTIRYELAKESFVSLKVFNLFGEDVATLVEGTRKAGVYMVQLDATKLVSGVYFYRLQAGEYLETKRMILLE